jgi:hypothetical protein
MNVKIKFAVEQVSKNVNKLGMGCYFLTSFVIVVNTVSVTNRENNATFASKVKPVLNGISRVQNIFPPKPGSILIKVYCDSHGT